MLFISLPSSAGTVQAGRYLDVSVEASYTQLWPLIKVVSQHYQYQHCKTIRCAIGAAAGQVGYSIYPGAMEVSAINTLNKPIPPIHRSFQNIQIIELIHALIGPAFQILVDPYDRYISFSLRSPSGLSQVIQTGASS